MADRSSKKTRLRAAKACHRCNVKRIKCDATQGIPCTKCRQSGNVDCILRQSRRGTYIRKTKHSLGSLEGDEQLQQSNSGDEQDTLDQNGEGPEETQSSPTQQIDDFNNLEHRQSPVPPLTETPVAPLQGQYQPELQTHGIGRQSVTDSTSTPQTNHDLLSPSTSRISVASSSYREMPWSAMFDHFLNIRQDRSRREFIDKASITYLGESFPLAIILDDFREGGMPKLHHPAPPYPGSSMPQDQDQDIPSSHPHPPHVPTQELEYLQAKGAFEYPEKAQWDEFMTIFLDRVFPIYPIFNLNELIQQYRNDTLPPILIHSICFLAATFCPIIILHRAGWTSRREARFSYYQKAKALFDAQYEVNKLVILQTVVMMSFWGGGPNNYWNFFGWLNIGVTIAETLGLHRSMATTNMKPVDKSLLRRLWWILVIRDAFCSSLVGRPFRIDVGQCDTEILTLDDFAHDTDFMEDSNKQAFANYQIHISKLSLVLREIVQARFYPRKMLTDTSQLHGKMVQWRNQLPSSLIWSDKAASDVSNLFSTTLAVCYHHNMILIYLGNTPINYASVADVEAIYNGDMAHSSAEYISSVLCSIKTTSKIHLMPHEFFHGIFLAEAKFYTEMRSNHRLISQLGCAALNSCQMVLHESWDSWDPSPWVMQLFDNLIRRVREEQQTTRAPAPAADGGISTPYNMDRMSWHNPSFMAFETDPLAGGVAYEPLQNHPMLSTLFEVPQDLFSYGLTPQAPS